MYRFGTNVGKVLGYSAGCDVGKKEGDFFESMLDLSIEEDLDARLVFVLAN